MNDHQSIQHKKYLTQSKYRHLTKKIFVITFGILFFLISCSPLRKTEAKSESSQTKSNKIGLLDTLRVSSKTLIIGKCGYNKDPYNLYSFLLKDSASIVQFAKSLQVGKEVLNKTDCHEFEIFIVNDHLVTTYIAIVPALNTIRLNGHAYEFDFGRVNNIYKKQPLIWNDQKVSFNNKKEADDYVNEIKKDSNLLYYFLPEFKYEGDFTITAKKSELFSSPKALMDYLTPDIEKIVSHNEYEMGYIVNINQIEKEIQSDSYTITISGSKKLFDNLNVDNVKKDNWNYAGKGVGLFCMKKQPN